MEFSFGDLGLGGSSRFGVLGGFDWLSSVSVTGAAGAGVLSTLFEPTPDLNPGVGRPREGLGATAGGVLEVSTALAPGCGRREMGAAAGMLEGSCLVVDTDPG